jgi:protein phosphatase
LIEAACASDIGPVRQTNEDSVLCDDELSIYVVADGMGGAAAGEVASGIAISRIRDFIWLSNQDSYLTWPFGYDPLLSEPANRLRTALQLANRDIAATARENDQYQGMGTTAVCALISDDQLTIGHAGDSRCYLFANGTLTRLTKDDSWVAAVAQGGGSERQGPPNRNVLTSALGVEQEVEVHLCERVLEDGDTLLLCSDGLHGVLDDEKLASMLTRSVSLADLSRELVEAALSSGTSDNVTAVLVRYKASER